jgi:hypothetical protein
MANTMILQPATLAFPKPGNQTAQHGGSAEPWFKETAAQTYVAQDLIYIDANGTIAVCTTATTNSVAQLNSAILGQPSVKATGVTGALVAFAAIGPAETYMMNAFHTTAASAVFAQTDLGLRFNVCKSAAGLWHVDKRNAVVTTLPMVRVVGFPSAGLNSTGLWVTNAGVGDVFGLAYVQFEPYYYVGAITGILDELQMWA